jgi:ribosomal protein S18 acetylase RimI-like enzyme
MTSATLFMPDLVDTSAGLLAVHRASLADAAAVLAVVRTAAAWVASRGSDQWAYYLTDDAAGLVRERIERHEVYLFRLGDGQAVGTLCLQWADTVYWPECGDDGMAGYVHQLAIDPAAVGGRGVGAGLLAWSADRIRAAGRSRFRLDCIASNVDLCRYYERQGFRRSGTVAPYGATAQRWERDLG